MHRQAHGGQTNKDNSTRTKTMKHENLQALAMEKWLKEHGKAEG